MLLCLLAPLSKIVFCHYARQVSQKRSTLLAKDHRADQTKGSDLRGQSKLKFKRLAQGSIGFSLCGDKSTQTEVYATSYCQCFNLFVSI